MRREPKAQLFRTWQRKVHQERQAAEKIKSFMKKVSSSINPNMSMDGRRRVSQGEERRESRQDAKRARGMVGTTGIAEEPECPPRLASPPVESLGTRLSVIQDGPATTTTEEQS